MTVEFFDTNLLVFAYDTSRGEKHLRCKQLVAQVFAGEREAVISNQVLAEFFTVVSKKIRNPIPAKDVAELVLAFVESPHWRKLTYSPHTVARAARVAAQGGHHLWDALIAQTMLDNELSEIVTDNEKDFSRFHGIRARSIE